MKTPSYRRKVVRAGRTVDIEETFPTQYGDGLTRKHKSGKGTPADVEAYNREIGIRNLGRTINENFSADDMWLTFHYEQNNRPASTEDADRIFKKLMSELKKEYDSRGKTLKWVRPKTALGERGGVHHHLLVSKGVELSRIRSIWREVSKASAKARPADCVMLFSTGEYSSLAAYIFDHLEKNGGCQKTPFDHAEKNIAPPNTKNIKRWSCSRNLSKPKSEPPETIYDIKWQEPPVPWNGYYIETDTIRAGCNPLTGRPYLFYRMVKLPPKFVCFLPGGKRIEGKEAVKWYRNNNKEFIKQNWIELNPEGEVIFRNEKGVKKNE